MKNISFYSIFFFLLAINVFSQDTINIYYDKEWKEIPNGNNASYYRKAFMDKNKVWVVYDYYISGKTQMTGSYKSKRFDVKQGHFIFYHENGQKMSEGNYLNNKVENEWSYWYENGQKKSEGKFLNDKNEGKWSYWYENGQKKSEGNFLSDKREGEWNFWNEKGELTDKEYYKYGQLNSAEGYFENGIRRYSGKYLNGKQNGVWTYWNPEGGIALKGNFKYGMKDGEWIKYFSDSKMTIYYNNGEIRDKKLGGIVRRD
jgi:antitoxin component YwqK of YwqJK toxin-antitoxin module